MGGPCGVRVAPAVCCDELLPDRFRFRDGNIRQVRKTLPVTRRKLKNSARQTEIVDQRHRQESRRRNNCAVIKNSNGVRRFSYTRPKNSLRTANEKNNPALQSHQYCRGNAPIHWGEPMLRAICLFVVGVVLTFASLAFGQETSIENALRISRRTGKPVFAIASRKVCQPCQILKSRVSALFRNRKIADQVVYLRVDLDSEDWPVWSRKFTYQGRMLPLVFLIRADEQQVYGESNTLPGDQLEKFIQQGVDYCGKSFSDTEVVRLEKANQSIQAALQANELDVAVQWVNTVSELGTPGKLNSYAEPALTNDKLVAQVASRSAAHVKSELGEISEGLTKDAAGQFESIYRFVKLEKSFGNFQNLADDFSAVAVKLAVNKDLRSLWSAARKICEANEMLQRATSEETDKGLRLLAEVEQENQAEVVTLAVKDIRRRAEAVVASREGQRTSK